MKKEKDLYRRWRIASRIWMVRSRDKMKKKCEEKESMRSYEDYRWSQSQLKQIKARGKWRRRWLVVISEQMIASSFLIMPCYPLIKQAASIRHSRASLLVPALFILPLWLDGGIGRHFLFLSMNTSSVSSHHHYHHEHYYLLFFLLLWFVLFFFLVLLYMSFLFERGCI